MVGSEKRVENEGFVRGCTVYITHRASTAAAATVADILARCQYVDFRSVESAKQNMRAS